jgi:hypothetical protein
MLINSEKILKYEYVDIKNGKKEEECVTWTQHTRVRDWGRDGIFAKLKGRHYE